MRACFFTYIRVCSLGESCWSDKGVRARALWSTYYRAFNFYLSDTRLIRCLHTIERDGNAPTLMVPVDETNHLSAGALGDFWWWLVAFVRGYRRFFGVVGWAGLASRFSPSGVDDALVVLNGSFAKFYSVPITKTMELVAGIYRG